MQYYVCNDYIFLGAAAEGVRSILMPFGIRQQVDQIRAYAARAEAQSGQAKELVTLMHRSADDLEYTAHILFAALGPAPAPLEPSAHIANPRQTSGKR
jgi:hypothetical protein